MWSRLGAKFGFGFFGGATLRAGGEKLERHAANRETVVLIVLVLRVHRRRIVIQVVGVSRSTSGR